MRIQPLFQTILKVIITEQNTETTSQNNNMDWNWSINGQSVTWTHSNLLSLTALHKQVLPCCGMSCWVEKVTPWCWPALKHANYLTNYRGWGRRGVSWISPIPFWDASGNDLLLGCWHAFYPIHIIQALIPAGDYFSALEESSPTSSTALRLIKTERWKEQRVCEGRKSSFSFWRKLLQLSGGTHPKGATVNILLSEQCGEPTECFPLPDRGLVTPPLSAQRWSTALMRSWPYSIRLFSPCFFLDVCLAFSCVCVCIWALPSSAGEKKSVVMV